MKKEIVISLATSLVLQSSALGMQKMSDVVVTAKSNQSIKDTAGNISIITTEDIKSMSATSLQEILEEVVGINVGVNNNSISGRQTISIRGADSKHSLILIDGKRISGSDAQIGHSDFQYSWLPINAIEKIEVIRGPMSALYGSKAMGGVVNIITKRPKKKIEGEIDVKKGWSSSEGGDEQDISLSIGGKVLDNFSFAAFIQREDIDKTYKEGDKKATLDREGKEITNKMLNLWYDIDETQQLNATILRGDEIREQQLYSSRTRSTSVYDEYYDIEKKHHAIGYKKHFDHISMDIKYYETISDSHTEQYKYTHELEDKVLNAEFTLDMFDKNFLVFGLEKSKEDYAKRYDSATTNMFSGFQNEIDNKSAYIQDEIEIGDNFLLVLGGRYDKHEKFGGEFTPKANVVYKIDSTSKLKVGYGEGFNAPTVTQNSSSYRFVGPHTFIGNDNLKPETSRSFDLGYEKYLDKTTFKVSIFKTDIEDLIRGVRISGGGGFSGMGDTNLYSNIDKVNIKGLELEFKQKDLISNVDFNLGYNYLKTEDETTGKELTAKPKHKINMKVKAKLPANIDSTLRVKYTGSQFNGNYEKRSGYTTVGLQFSKELIKNLTGRIGVENLTNEQLEDPDNYQIKGRVSYIGLNYKF